MEGTGMMTSLEFLDRAGLVDRDRAAMLPREQLHHAHGRHRPRGKAARASATIPHSSHPSGRLRRSPVVRALVEGWEHYEDSSPAQHPSPQSENMKQPEEHKFHILLGLYVGFWVSSTDG